MTRIMVVSNPLTMRKFLGGHAAKITQPDTAGQASSGTLESVAPGCHCRLARQCLLKPSPCVLPWKNQRKFEHPGGQKKLWKSLPKDARFDPRCTTARPWHAYPDVVEGVQGRPLIENLKQSCQLAARTRGARRNVRRPSAFCSVPAPTARRPKTLAVRTCCAKPWGGIVRSAHLPQKCPKCTPDVAGGRLRPMELALREGGLRLKGCLRFQRR
jgi:hypothetical protein